MMLILLTYLSISLAAAVVPGSATNNEIYQTKAEKRNSGSWLYPQASVTRDVKTLDGIWNFRLSPSIDPDYGYKLGWQKQDLALTGEVIPMPVPSSYNDVTTNKTIRDHVGLVWYDRRFHVSPFWLKNDQRIWLRFSSIHYAAQVWLNGRLVGSHEIGHLPFEMEVTDLVFSNSSNLLTVVVDNTLLSDTVPQGSVSKIYSGNRTVRLGQTYTFDFFNYAGIHRTVFLYSTPKAYIDDIIVNTDIQGLTGFLVYNVTYKGAPDDNVYVRVELYDKEGKHVVSAFERAGLLEVVNVRLWWPYLMHDNPGYLYTLKVFLMDTLNDNLIDTYEEKIGFRTITWTNSSVYLNDKPLYMRGFGMHEDSDWRGKGWDPVLWTKNFDLIRWLGANAFRTSHYPYAEEIYQMADEQGIMIIDECPSVDTDFFFPVLLKKHKQSLHELIHRDKNHPSVIMWSISNEPRTFKAEAGPYFEEVVKYVKSMDQSRPVTIAISQYPTNDKAAQHLDVIAFNRYSGWYSETGVTRNIVKNLVNEATAWHTTHNKPVFMTEYGADTLAGMHMLPDFVFSEEYQVALMSEHFKGFDELRQLGFFVGEFIWNFADFKTIQQTTRVGGNKKGIFTRAREPKAAAHHMRARYLALAAADAGRSPPAIANYISDHLPAKHEEV